MQSTTSSGSSEPDRDDQPDPVQHNQTSGTGAASALQRLKNQDEHRRRHQPAPHPPGRSEFGG